MSFSKGTRYEVIGHNDQGEVSIGSWVLPKRAWTAYFKAKQSYRTVCMKVRRHE